MKREELTRALRNYRLQHARKRERDPTAILRRPANASYREMQRWGSRCGRRWCMYARRTFHATSGQEEPGGEIDAAAWGIHRREKSSVHRPACASWRLLSGGHREEERRGEEKRTSAVSAREIARARVRPSVRLSVRPKMSLTPRCRGGGGENLSEDLANEDDGLNGGNFEPLSDSCGESDMEGLDLSLFEPQVDAASWCDSRIHAGTLHILVHYCGKLCLHDIPSLSTGLKPMCIDRVYGAIREAITVPYTHKTVTRKFLLQPRRQAPFARVANHYDSRFITLLLVRRVLLMWYFIPYHKPNTFLSIERSNVSESHPHAHARWSYAVRIRIGNSKPGASRSVSAEMKKRDRRRTSRIITFVPAEVTNVRDLLGFMSLLGAMPRRV